MKEKKILITGANGQLGNVLSEELRKKYGKEAVLATDIHAAKFDNSPFRFLDILNTNRIREVLVDEQITEVYHMAAILSANGEWNPSKTWHVNLTAYLDLLNICKDCEIEKLFFPSTIAIHGKTTPKVNTPQHCAMLPETVYGMSKVAGEYWGNYYSKRYGMDIRSVRYPGIISHQSLPGGGTTDYAVEIFYSAIKGEKFVSFLERDTRLPMMYIEDAIRATIELMSAPKENIKIRSSYNLAAISFTPEELYHSIQRYYPDFEIEYKPDFRQQIAESWSQSIDDAPARADWNWNHRYDLDKMVDEMIENLKNKL